MANKIVETNLRPDSFVDQLSRYANEEVIYYGELNRITFKTYKRENVPRLEDDKFMVISTGYEFRPDLVAHDVYGTPNLWWRIMQANNIFDIYEFKRGRNIRVPSAIF